MVKKAVDPMHKCFSGKTLKTLWARSTPRQLITANAIM